MNLQLSVEVRAQQHQLSLRRVTAWQRIGNCTAMTTETKEQFSSYVEKKGILRSDWLFVVPEGILHVEN